MKLKRPTRRKLTGAQAAALAGVQPGTWRRYTTPNRSRGGKLHGPAPDGHSDPCGCPWWWEDTVLAWLDRPVPAHLISTDTRGCTP